MLRKTVQQMKGLEGGPTSDTVVREGLSEDGTLKEKDI